MFFSSQQKKGICTKFYQTQISLIGIWWLKQMAWYMHSTCVIFVKIIILKQIPQ